MVIRACNRRKEEAISAAMLARVFTLCLCLAYNMVLPALSLAATPTTAHEQTINASPLLQPGSFECSAFSRDQWRELQRHGNAGNDDATSIAHTALGTDGAASRQVGRNRHGGPMRSWHHRRCIRSHLGDDNPAA